VTGRNPYAAFGLNLETARHTRGWSQETAARHAGLGLATLQRAEYGRPVYLHTAIALAHLYETTLDALLNGKPE
jgi:DNA-binding XRE family transcriptional regulator